MSQIMTIAALVAATLLCNVEAGLYPFQFLGSVKKGKIIKYGEKFFKIVKAGDLAKGTITLQPEFYENFLNPKQEAALVSSVNCSGIKHEWIGKGLKRNLKLTVSKSALSERVFGMKVKENFRKTKTEVQTQRVHRKKTRGPIRDRALDELALNIRVKAAAKKILPQSPVAVVLGKDHIFKGESGIVIGSPSRGGCMVLLDNKKLHNGKPTRATFKDIVSKTLADEKCIVKQTPVAVVLHKDHFHAGKTGIVTGIHPWGDYVIRLDPSENDNDGANVFTRASFKHILEAKGYVKTMDLKITAKGSKQLYEDSKGQVIKISRIKHW